MSRFRFPTALGRSWALLAMTAVAGLTFASPRAEGRDCSEGGRPSFASHLELSSPAGAMALSGRYAFVSQGFCWGWCSGTVHVFDVVDGTSRASLPIFSSCIEVDGGRAYLGGLEFQILDVSDPTAPHVVGKLPTLYTSDLAVAQSHAYLVDLDGLQIIDVSDPTSPASVASLTIPGPAWAVAVNSSYAYVAAGDAGLTVVDVSDPTSPTVVGTCALPGRALDVVIRGSRAYVVGDAGLQVLDVSAPAAPRLVGIAATPGPAQRVAVSGARAYVAGGALWVIDISKPAHPVIVNSIEDSFTVDGPNCRERRDVYALVSASEERVAVAGGILNHIIVCEPAQECPAGVGCDWENGLLNVAPASAYEPPPPCSRLTTRTVGSTTSDAPARVSGVAIPSIFALRGNEPNPFNPETSIHYDVPRSSRVQIQIYDAQGSLVQTLLDETLPPGQHEVSWRGRSQDGNAVASGIYFVVMEAEGIHKVKKITLLK